MAGREHFSGGRNGPLEKESTGGLCLDHGLYRKGTGGSRLL
jgi:hypothetical protein